MLPDSKRHLADDLAQDCLVRMIERVDQFDPSIAKFSTWRRCIVRSVVLDDFRRWRFRSGVPAPDFMGHPNDSDPVANALNAEFEMRLTKALRRLRKTRRTVCDAMWRGQSAERIAKKSRLTQNTVRVHARNGFEDLGWMLMPEVMRRAEAECCET